MRNVLLALAFLTLFSGCGKDSSIIGSLDQTALKDAEVIAFPGAEGAGKFTKGGRGGDVYHVTTLQDSGPGSFREGIESIEGPRTIVFDLSGTIRLKKEVKIKDVSYLTIAGQTAPGKGITFADRNLRIENCSHVIARYFRIRLGDENKPDGTSPDCITIEYSNHVILDHLSLSWGIDGNGDFRGLKHSTLQWLIFSEALHDSIHEKGSHAMCTSFRESAGFATLHHNIYATSRNRHPSTAGGSQVMDFANNLNYNWSGCHNLSGEQYNLLNNYYKAGPMKGDRLPIRYKSKALKSVSRGYFFGNHFEGLPEQYNKDNYTAMDFESSGIDGKYKGTTRKFFEATERFDAGKYKLTRLDTAQEAYESCLKQSGCSLERDAVDERLIESIRNNTGKVIDSQRQVGGWDRYSSIVRSPDFDTDRDGMPDEWERNFGLNPNDPVDGNQDRDEDGFTNLEDYLNGLTER